MKMSIYDAERLLRNHLDGVTNYCERELTDKAIQVAIEAMRKYQKIVDIVSLNGEEFKQCGLKELKEILEVIADGNDD